MADVHYRNADADACAASGCRVGESVRGYGGSCGGECAVGGCGLAGAGANGVGTAAGGLEEVGIGAVRF